MMDEGRQAFRFDTFRDEAFWGDTLQLHLAIEGAFRWHRWRSQLKDSFVARAKS
jgi:hypothetical protein